MTPMRDEWLFGTWDRLRERVQIDADAGPLWLLQPLEERWVEGALVTRLSDDVRLYVHRDRISFGDTSLDRDEVLAVNARVWRPEPDQRNAWAKYYLELAARGERRLHVEVPDPLSARELARILKRWKDDDAIREAWGSTAVEPLLQPTLDRELVEAREGTYTADGIRFPCLGYLDRVDGVGCIAMFAMLAAAPLFGLLLGPWATLLWGAFVVLVALGAAIWRYDQVSHGQSLLVGQTGMVLADGTRVAYDEICGVVPGDRHLLALTEDSGFVVYTRCGFEVGLAIHALSQSARTPEGEEPEDLTRLRRFVAQRS